MTSFLGAQYYSPLVTALVGLVTFVGLLGLGAALLRIFRFRLPSPWQEVLGVLLGIEALSLTVQIVGMAGVASGAVLVAIWVGLVSVGGVAAIWWARNPIAFWKPPGRRLELLLLLMLLTAVAVNFLVAIAPSTKIDELYYHMLVPSRIVTSGALQFYQQPLMAAILPQMTFQISMAPLHALKCPDAANVVSWALSLTLLWFAWCLLNENKKSATWVYLWIATLVVGMYSVVWHVTGGSHAMGDLSLAAACVAFYKRRQLLDAVSPGHYAGMFSIFLLSAASAKISLLPLSAALLVLTGFLLLRSVTRAEVWRVAFALVIPWTVFALPLMLWTFSKSGSPFGPLLSGVFSTSVYNVQLLKDTIESMRQLNRPSLTTVLGYALLSHHALFWLGMFGSFFIRGIPRSTRLAGALFLIFQSFLIYMFLPYDARFLGGLSYGLVICFALFAASTIDSFLSSKRSLAISVILLSPWLGVQIYYARQFFPVSLGLQKKSEFYKKYVALYADYEQLDQILPKDSVLVTHLRSSAVYSPRPIYNHAVDLPQDKELFVLGCASGDQEPETKWPGYKIGEIVYRNPQAVIITYRTPGRDSISKPICVARLTRK